MKLYRAKIPVIAEEIIKTLADEEMIEVSSSLRSEAEKDLVAIMDEYMRRDNDFRNLIKDEMAASGSTYDQYSRVRSRVAEEQGHPTGDDVERFLARQFIENLLISPNIEEVFAEDKDLHKKIMSVLREHHVDERVIREEAMEKIKNIKEGTVDYEIALQGAMRDVRKRRGLLT